MYVFFVDKISFGLLQFRLLKIGETSFKL